MLKKPVWLNKKINLRDCRDMELLLGDLKLNTVCKSAQCPNISECFERRYATFLILGNVCTRGCGFCNVQSGETTPVDSDEPERIACAVLKLNLRQVVITSVTRDDLSDGGAGHFAKTIRCIRKSCPEVKIEILIPDFLGEQEPLRTAVLEKPDIIGHNLETVPRLYRVVRNKASYQRSLKVLTMIKELNSKIYTKSGIMLGMGERHQEVNDVLSDLRKAGCDFVSLGQYLAPSSRHYPVQEYIRPEIFEDYRKKALEMGFKYAASAPYVRSSYQAEDYL